MKLPFVLRSTLEAAERERESLHKDYRYAIDKLGEPKLVTVEQLVDWFWKLDAGQQEAFFKGIQSMSRSQYEARSAKSPEAIAYMAGLLINADKLTACEEHILDCVGPKGLKELYGNADVDGYEEFRS